MRIRYLWLSSLLPIFFTLATSYGKDVPPAILSGLSSEVFELREKAELELLEWAKIQNKASIGELIQLSRTSDDPEVRQRCGIVLRKLSDADYLLDGKGYLGINMLEEILPVGENGMKKFGIRVVAVVKGSPAEEAGILQGDLIVGLQGKTWSEVGAVTEFTETIGRMKPLTKISILLQRQNQKQEEVTVLLGKRPVDDLRMAQSDIQVLDQNARAQHYSLWLKEREQ